MENKLPNLGQLDLFQRIPIQICFLNSQDQLGPFCLYLKTIKERTPPAATKAVMYTKLCGLWHWTKWNWLSYGSYLYSLNIDLGELYAPNLRFIPYGMLTHDAQTQRKYWRTAASEIVTVLVLNHRFGLGTLLKNVIYASKVLPGLLHLLLLRSGFGIIVECPALGI